MWRGRPRPRLTTVSSVWAGALAGRHKNERWIERSTACLTLGTTDGPHLSTPASSAEELIAAVGLQSRNVDSGRHLQNLQDLSGSRIDSPQIALVTFPGAV